MSWLEHNRWPRETRDTWLLLGVMAWVVAPLYSVVPLWCSSVSALVMLWRGWLAWRERAMPPRWVRLVLLVLSLSLTAMSFKTILGPDAGVTLIVALLAIKTLELRARRDALVVFFLCFFLMLTQFFYGQSLLNALGMLLGVLGLLTALINAHSPVEPAPLLTSAKLALRMTLLGLPLMVALYGLFPRVAPLWGLPSQAPVASSGLSADMTVGSVAQLALDRSVALRLRFDGPEPDAAGLYFRGPVLSDFDGRQWQARRSNIADWAQQAITSGAPLSYELILQAHHQNWLLSLDATVRAPDVADGQVRVGTELQWLRPRGVHTVLRYRAQAFEQVRWAQALSPAQRAANTALPAASNPQTRAWAAELLAQAPLAMRDRRHGDYNAYWAQRALTILRQGEYRYTLTPGVYSDHTADVFWFSRRAGFCEHIASAYAVLMRALGVPARIVTGYQGGERNPVDGWWTVRQSDAHAWVEVWLPGHGWQRVDPTAAIAPQRIEQGSPLAISDALLPSSSWRGLSVRWVWRARWVWEALNNRWNQWVLGYEQTQQLALLRWLGFQTPDWQDLVGLLAGLAALASAAVLAWLKWHQPRPDPWLTALGQARQRLRQAGLVCPDQSSPRGLAQALAWLGDQQPAQVQLCQAWVDCLLQLERWRYDRPQGTAHSKAALATLQRQCQTLALPQFPKSATRALSEAHPV